MKSSSSQLSDKPSSNKRNRSVDLPLTPVGRYQGQEEGGDGVAAQDSWSSTTRYPLEKKHSRASASQDVPSETGESQIRTLEFRRAVFVCLLCAHVPVCVCPNILQYASRSVCECTHEFMHLST